MIRRSLELAASLLRHRSAAETRHKRNDGSLATVRAICFAMIRLFLFHIQFFCSTFLVHQIWGESRIWMPLASQKRLAMCKMNNSREGTFTCPSGNSFICTFNFFKIIMGFCFTKKLYCSFPNLIVIVLAWHFTNCEKKCNKNALPFCAKYWKTVKCLVKRSVKYRKIYENTMYKIWIMW